MYPLEHDEVKQIGKPRTCTNYAQTQRPLDLATRSQVYTPPRKKLVNIRQTSQCLVTAGQMMITLYGERSCSIVGTVTASEEAHRKRVTGGILRSSERISSIITCRYRVQNKEEEVRG